MELMCVQLRNDDQFTIPRVFGKLTDIPYWPALCVRGLRNCKNTNCAWWKWFLIKIILHHKFSTNDTRCLCRSPMKLPIMHQLSAISMASTKLGKCAHLYCSNLQAAGRGLPWCCLVRWTPLGEFVAAASWSSRSFKRFNSWVSGAPCLLSRRFKNCILFSNGKALNASSGPWLCTSFARCRVQWML